MEMRLQQAIVATKAGRPDIAQHLLFKLLQDTPDDADAWFLLGHLADTPERRSVYLGKSVDLDPDHGLAQQHLLESENNAIPAAVVMQQSSRTEQIEQAPSNLQAAEPMNVDEAPDGLQDLEDNQLDVKSTGEDEWQELTGAPVRETQSSSNQALPPTVPQETSRHGPHNDRTSGEIWLVRILVIMVIVATIILGILVLLLLV